MNRSTQSSLAAGALLVSALVFCVSEYLSWQRQWAAVVDTGTLADHRPRIVAHKSTPVPQPAYATATVSPLVPGVHRRPTVIAAANREPALLESYRTAYISNLSLRYQDFFRVAGLPAEQQQQFLQIQFARRKKIEEAWTPDAEGKLSKPVSELERDVAEYDQIAASALTSALGQDGYANLKEYQSTMHYRDTVNRFAAVAFEAGDSLNAKQLQLLTALLADSQIRVTTDADGAPNVQPPEVYTATLELSANIVSPHLNTILQDVLDQQQVSAILRQLRLKGKKF